MLSVKQAMPRTHLIRPLRSLATTEARTQLPTLVGELVSVSEPGETLAAHAVEVGPRHRGGVWLVPAVDADAAMDREAELRDRVEALEDEAENMALGFFLMNRLEQSSGETVSGDDFIREFGNGELLDESTS
jgi:hypothetical protein